MQPDSRPPPIRGKRPHTMTDLTLSAALRHYEYNDALFDGRAHDGLTLAIASYEGALLNAMRAMLRERAYDLCEMSPSSYLIARQAGASLVGLPVFPFCQYPLGQIVVRAGSPITEPRQLQGTTIGVRTWAQPTAVWARSYLMDYLGVDLSGVTWVFVADDPVPGLRRPAGAVERRGESLASLLVSGAVEAVIGQHDMPEGGRALIADPECAAAQWTRDTGVVPANHLMVLDARHLGSDAPERVCRRFADVVREHLAQGDTRHGVIGELLRINPHLPPLPSGRKANERMWRALVNTMVRQGMIDPVAEPMDLLFDWNPA